MFSIRQSLFPTDQWVMLAAIVSTMTGMFFITLGSDSWVRIGMFYAISALLGVFIVYMNRPTYVTYPYPPFIPLLITFALSIGMIALLGNYINLEMMAQSTANDVLRTLLVANTEEFVFHLALPLLFLSLFLHKNSNSLLFALILSNLIFAMFHLFAYNADLAALMGAFALGMIQSLAYVVGNKYGPAAYFGLVGGHLAWNMQFFTEQWPYYTFLYLLFMSLFLTLMSRGHRHG